MVERLDERLNVCLSFLEGERVAPAFEGMQIWQVRRQTAAVSSAYSPWCTENETCGAHPRKECPRGDIDGIAVQQEHGANDSGRDFFGELGGVCVPKGMRASAGRIIEYRSVRNSAAKTRLGPT
jgi:hypothetical protein